MDDRSIEKLVIAARNADRSAYAKLITHYYRSVYLTCMGILADTHDAEDIAQDTLLKGYTKINSLRKPARFGPWITTIARNKCINLIRKSKPKTTLPQDIPARGTTHLPKQDLLKAITRLPRDLRLPLVLYYFNGQNVKAIAQQMKISPSNVYLKLRSATGQLHDLMTDLGD